MIALACSFGLACSMGEASRPVSRAEAQRDPTYYDDVQPLLEQHCVKCHYEGGVAPFSLTSYEDAHGKANLMSQEVAARRMPPWGAQDSAECSPPFGWQGDERLTDDEISLLRRWALTGAPAGDLPTETSYAIATNLSSLAEPTFDLAPLTPYLPPTDRDDFRCFVLEIPELDAGAYISGVDVVPGDRRIVHHATVWSDPDGIAAQRAEPDGSFECRDINFAPDARLSWLISWAPGAKPLELRSDIAIEIPPRSKIIMQIHYSVGGREIAPDSTHLQLRVAPNKPSWVLTPWTIGNTNVLQPNGDGLLPQPDDPPSGPEFRIPAREADHVEAIQTTMLGDPMRLYAIRTHAHLAATDIKLDLLHTRGPDEPPEGNVTDQCLLQDRWDFHWQRVYSYDAPLENLPIIQPGDRVILRCTYDNTMANRRLGDELYERGLQPFDIVLGDATLDEMCLADLLYLRKLD